jgi:ribonuclease-3
MSSRASVEARTGASSDRGASLRSVLESALGYNFVDPELLIEALSHRSWCAEHGGPSNERLEFLGDAVLGLMVAEWTYQRHPEQPEGHLAKIRASVVSARAVADTARNVSLGDALLLGRGEAKGGGREKDSILSDALEAVLGAVYLDGGHEAASCVVRNLFARDIDHAAAAPGFGDYKTRLQELAVYRSGNAPRYDLITEGPDHEKRFHATVEVAGEVFGPASGTSRKRAEQVAALLACQALEDRENGGSG